MSANIEWARLLKKNAEKLKDSASALKAVKVESVKTVLLGEIRVP